MRFIIIGGVAAGMSAAMKLRRDMPDAEIVVYQKEEVVSYGACGLPYYLGGEVASRDKLIIRTAEEFREKSRISLYTGHEVTKISPENRKVFGVRLEDGFAFSDYYDKLLIATGASPVMPEMPGSHAKNIFKLRSITDADAIYNYMMLNPVRKAVIIGDGLIAMEMAEAFLNRNIECTVISANPVIMKMFDPEIGQIAEKHLEEKGVKLFHDYMVDGFVVNEAGNATAASAQGKENADGDLFLVSIGIKPNTAFAAQAGLKTGIAGALVTDEFMKTSDEHIFAAGDCAQTTNMITKQPAWLPLGSTANKMGRVAALNMLGKQVSFKGIAGTSVAKICDITVGKCGLSEFEAKNMGLEYAVVEIEDPARPGYYHYVGKNHYKLLYEPKTGKLLGLQAVGKLGIDKRIDVFSTAAYAGLKVEDLFDLDLAYSPPYNKPIDSLHVMSMQAERGEK